MLLWRGHTKSNPAAVWCEKSKCIGTKRKLSAIWYHRKASELEPNGSYLQFGTKKIRENWYQTEESFIWYQSETKNMVRNGRFQKVGTKTGQKKWNQIGENGSLVACPVQRHGTKRKQPAIWSHGKASELAPNGSNPQFGPMEKQANWYQTEAICNLVPWKASVLGPNGSTRHFSTQEEITPL